MDGDSALPSWETDLPHLALSVRQPWAWAIIHAGKDIENRSIGSIRAGKMEPGTICIHAATGMSQREYRWAMWRLQKDGMHIPPPDQLIRRALIGVVNVVEIVEVSDSPWFGGQMGLRLENPRAIDPIPAAGALGYFAWERSGDFSPAKPWMSTWDRANGDAATLPLFPDLDTSFKQAPEKPFGTGAKRGGGG